jgi:hypothetical protein
VTKQVVRRSDVEEEVRKREAQYIAATSENPLSTGELNDQLGVCLSFECDRRHRCEERDSRADSRLQILEGCFVVRHRNVVKAYEAELSLALVAALLKSHINPKNVVVASVFTTQSVTATLEKIRNQIHGATPAPADFMIASGGTRALFNAADIAAITWNIQFQDVPPLLFPVTTDYSLGLSLAPAAVGQIAYGRYSSPRYLNPDVVIPTVGTLTGVPAVLGANDIYFNLALPSGPKPAHGWPVAIFGTGLNSAKDFSMPYFMAEHGIGTLYINTVGHGWGPQSTITLTMTDSSSTTIPAPGRTVDQNGDDIIDGGAIFSSVPEGFLSTGPNAALHRDSVQQTAADLVQLVREIEVGIEREW